MLKKILKTDSFSTWKDKINEIIDQQSEVISFNIDTENTINLNLVVQEGKVREKSEVTTVPETVLSLEPSAVNYVGISIDVEFNPVIVSGPIANKPVSRYIHLYEVSTSVVDITSITDLRTVYSAADASSSTVDNASAILQFEQSIFSDVVISSTKNAISVSPTIEDGVTVTISEGSIWSIV